MHPASMRPGNRHKHMLYFRCTARPLAIQSDSVLVERRCTSSVLAGSVIIAYYMWKVGDYYMWVHVPGTVQPAVATRSST